MQPRGLYYMKRNEDERGQQTRPNYLVFVTFMGISGLSLMAGFTYRILSFKKANAMIFMQANSQNKTMHESGTHLAARALGIATVITTMSLGALALFVCYIIKPSDQNNFDGRTQSIFPSRCK
nr:Protein Chibby (PKD2 interactor, Golgi and endoplasmic reticulum associated 1) [Schistosoma japonicum]